MNASFERRSEDLRSVGDGNLVIEQRIGDTVRVSKVTRDEGRKVSLVSSREYSAADEIMCI